MVTLENPFNINIATDGTTGTSEALLTAGKTLTGASVRLVKGALSLKIYITGEVIEDYENPAFVFTPPTSPSDTTGTTPDSIQPIALNLLAVTDTFDVDGAIDSSDRDTLRDMVKMGNDKNTPMYLYYDTVLNNADVPSHTGIVTGILTRVKIHRPAVLENDEWPVEITFKRANAQ